jgi:hypothetical protein
MNPNKANSNPFQSHLQSGGGRNMSGFRLQTKAALKRPHRRFARANDYEYAAIEDLAMPQGARCAGIQCRSATLSTFAGLRRHEDFT